MNKKRYGLYLLILTVIFACKKETPINTSEDGVNYENPIENLFEGKIDSQFHCATDRRILELHGDDDSYWTDFNETEIVESRNINNVIIPVHFIIVYDDIDEEIGEGGNFCLEQIQNQLNLVNSCFSAEGNPYIDDRAPIDKFPVAKNTNIQFQLATIDPNGNPTNSVDRVFSKKWPTKEDSILSATRWDTEKYLNVWVVPDVLIEGQSRTGKVNDIPTPRREVKPENDGILISKWAFGSPENFPNGAKGEKFGITMVHELGHWLGLYHVFGKKSTHYGICPGVRNVPGEGLAVLVVGDGIKDTPQQKFYSQGKPSYGSIITCDDKPDMTVNYMDYSADGWRGGFTYGQVQRMYDILRTSRVNITAAAYTVIKGNVQIPACGEEGNSISLEPTCMDGMKNGDETGTDCGGSKCDPCPTCNDGFQNGDEEGEDCGGTSCPPCLDAPACTDGMKNGDETGIDCGGSKCDPCKDIRLLIEDGTMPDLKIKEIVSGSEDDFWLISRENEIWKIENNLFSKYLDSDDTRTLFNLRFRQETNSLLYINGKTSKIEEFSINNQSIYTHNVQEYNYDSLFIESTVFSMDIASDGTIYGAGLLGFGKYVGLTRLKYYHYFQINSFNEAKNITSFQTDYSSVAPMLGISENEFWTTVIGRTNWQGVQQFIDGERVTSQGLYSRCGDAGYFIRCITEFNGTFSGITNQSSACANSPKSGFIIYNSSEDNLEFYGCKEVLTSEFGAFKCGASMDGSDVYILTNKSKVLKLNREGCTEYIDLINKYEFSPDEWVAGNNNSWLFYNNKGILILKN